MSAGSRILALLLLGGLCLGGCQDVEDGRIRRPLQDVRHVDDFLLEEPRLVPRPTHDGNRFLAGWWPMKQPGGLLLIAGEGTSARLELVHLEQRPRLLALDLEGDPPGPEARVEIRAAGRELGSVPLMDPLEIALPADLPPGRVLVELRPLDATLRVREARVQPTLEAGEIHWQDGELRQRGASRVDFVRRVQPGDSLAGSFHPPSGARDGQSFRIVVESENSSAAISFDWSAGWLNRLRGRRDFAFPLSQSEGLVRIRLEALGEGPTARWADLALISASPLPVTSQPNSPSEQPDTVIQPDTVVLYVMDALRADALTHLGGLPGVTPVIDQLAREGMTFRAHRSLAPNTLPSTKALITGEAYVDRGGWKLPADGATTLAERWRKAGYRTGLFSGNVYVGRSYGVDRGFEQVTEIPVQESKSPNKAHNNNGEQLHDAALRWLGTLTTDERAFLYIHAIHPHNPYDPPDPWRSELTRGIASRIDGSTRTLLAVNHRRLEIDEGDRERLRRLYAAALAHIDTELGRFLAAAESLMPDRRLLVVVTSDHGEELFEHGGVLHGYTLYDEMIRIPLVVWSPGLVVPGEYTAPTSTLDLHATLARLAGRPVESPDAGRSLLPVLLGQRHDLDSDPGTRQPHLAAAASVKGGIYSIQSSRWKLIWAPRTALDWGLGGGLGRTRSPEYLFDLEDDPGELRNRAGEGDLEVLWLRSRLRAWIKTGKAPNLEEADAGVDDETRRRLEALGYVN